MHRVMITLSSSCTFLLKVVEWRALAAFVMHMGSCKKMIRNLVTRVHETVIGVLREESTWGNQDSLIPCPDYEHQVSSYMYMTCYEISLP